MNAPARPPTRLPGTPPVDFLVLLPTIERHVSYAFHQVPADFRQDVLQEALVRAFVTYRRLVDQGRQGQVFATPLARFAILRVRDSCRVGSRRNRRDVSRLFPKTSSG